MIRRPPRSTLFPYTDALPISLLAQAMLVHALAKGLSPDIAKRAVTTLITGAGQLVFAGGDPPQRLIERLDRKSTRLNSSHLVISYAVFCLKKKKIAYASTDDA